MLLILTWSLVQHCVTADVLECLKITLSFLSNLNLLGLVNLDNYKMCMLCILESTFKLVVIAAIVTRTSTHSEEKWVLE